MNLYLIGYRGTGKTTLARVIAERTRRIFLDTDALVVKSEGRSVAEIFRSDGERHFREAEKKALREAAEYSGRNAIVSTGGGIVLDPDNRDLMRQTGRCVYLTLEATEILKRISRDDKRPALTELSPLEEIRHVLAEREPLYRELADLTLDTGLVRIEDCVREIRKKGLIP